MRIALGFACLAAVTMVAAAAAGEPSMSEANRWGVGTVPALPVGRGAKPPVESRGLSLEQIRGVMRANAGAFHACLTAAVRRDKQLHGPFVYQIEVDKKGKVISARPYQPSSVASFDRCITGVLKRARFPGGPASVEAPLPFERG
jgi:hypothetical protein